MSRTITVKGTGHLRISPDQVQLFIDIAERDRVAEKAAAAADRKIGTVRKDLESEGFAPDDLKTLNFSMSPEYIWDKNGNRKSNGFLCSHRLKIAFPLDRERLRRVMDRLAGSEAEPSFDVQFTLEEPEAAREELLRLAAENARKKAEILCGASGVKLGELKEITYGVSRPELVSPVALRMEAKAARGASNDAAVMSEQFEPESIEASDDATFTWEMT